MSSYELVKRTRIDGDFEGFDDEVLLSLKMVPTGFKINICIGITTHTAQKSTSSEQIAGYS